MSQFQFGNFENRRGGLYFSRMSQFQFGNFENRGGKSLFLPSSASVQLNSTSTSIEAEIALFSFSDPHSPIRKSTTTSSMSAISQLLLTQFQQNFKGRFLGPS